MRATVGLISLLAAACGGEDEPTPTPAEPTETYVEPGTGEGALLDLRASETVHVIDMARLRVLELICPNGQRMPMTAWLALLPHEYRRSDDGQLVLVPERVAPRGLVDAAALAQTARDERHPDCPDACEHCDDGMWVCVARCTEEGGAETRVTVGPPCGDAPPDDAAPDDDGAFEDRGGNDPPDNPGQNPSHIDPPKPAYD